MAKNVFKVLIMTAIQAEFDAVLSLLPNKINNIDINLGNYGFGYEDISSNDKVEFYVGQTGQGNVNSSIKIQKFLSAHEFNLALFVGIAGTRKTDFEVFDVVFAEKIGYHEMTKEEANETLSRPEIENINQELIDIASFLNHEINNDKIQNWFGKERIQTKNGNILSGEKIIENNFSQVGKRIHTDFNQMQVIEMEGFGFCKSCRLNNLTYFGVIRGISDIISNSVDTKAINPNSSKRDSNTITYASKNAAMYSFKFISIFLKLEIKKKSIKNEKPIVDLNIYDRFNQLNETLKTLQDREATLISELSSLKTFVEKEQNQDKREYFSKNISLIMTQLTTCGEEIVSVSNEITIFENSINNIYEIQNFKDSSKLMRVRQALDNGNLIEAYQTLTIEELKKSSETYLRTKDLLSNSGNILSQEYITKANLAIATKNNIEKYSEATLLFEEAAKTNSDYKVSFDIAFFFDGIGNYDKAVIEYENTIKLNPDQVLLGQIYHNLGIIFRRKNKYELAERNYELAIGIKQKLSIENPKKDLINLANSYSAFGVFYTHFSKYDKAANCFRHAIKILTDLNDNYKLYYGDHLARAYSNFANLLRQQGDIENAEKLYLESIEILKKYSDFEDNAIHSSYLNCLIGICNSYISNHDLSKVSIYIPEIQKLADIIFKTEPYKYFETYCKSLLILGQITSKINRAEDSFYYFNKILALIPQPIEPKNRILALLARQGLAGIYTYLIKDFNNFFAHYKIIEYTLETLDSNISDVQNLRRHQKTLMEEWKS